MSPLPQLNLNLGIIDGASVPNNNENRDPITVRTDSELKKYTISMIISAEETGKIILTIGDKEMEIPTYKMTVTDDRTNETEAYQVTRDTLSFVRTKTRKSILSFLGFKRFEKTSFLYENIAFEPQIEDLERYALSKHRQLTPDMLTYELKGNGGKVILYAGDLNAMKKPDPAERYFIIADGNHGKTFIGDILYREKFLKLTPAVELQLIKRKNIPRNFEYDDKGHIRKLIYL